MYKNLQGIVGWDIGGAHLKAARLNTDGEVLQVFQRPTPLWRGLAVLESAMDEILSALPAGTYQHTVTMTGELADIFPHRAEGVRALTEIAVQQCPGPVQMYAGRHGLVAPHTAHPDDIASANWHASAAFIAAQQAHALLVDIGSTTTDLIPLQQGTINASGYTDFERLHHRELVYTGVVRTPVMALAQHIRFEGRRQPLVAELFATTADIYRLTGELDPAHDMENTADGAGKSLAESARRLARMVACDANPSELARWQTLAHTLRRRQLRQLAQAANHVLSHRVAANTPIIGAGAGNFLARALAHKLGREYLDAASLIRSAHAEEAGLCLPAVAVAWLGRPR